MTNKYLKFIISISVILCVLCSSLTVVFAAPNETTGDTTEIETDIFKDPDVTEEDTTKKVGLIIGEPTTEPVTSVSATTEPETTEPTTVNKKPSYNNNTQTTRRKTTTEKETEVAASITSTTAEETTLPEGSFYVYLELNNGQPRLKRILNEPGLVPQPNDPVRKGYIFDGWYADAQLTTQWNFFSSVADEKTVIYAKWVADASTVVYNVKVAKMVGGSVQVNPMTASEGEPVIITVLPEEGKRVVAGSLKINGESSDVFSFIMPAKDVVISAEFEDIPASELNEEDEKSVFPFVIGAAIIVIAIIVVVIIVLRRRAILNNVEFDENGALIIDDDDDDVWIDESIVIEDGFANGKKFKENVEPDYGDSEVNNDY